MHGDIARQLFVTTLKRNDGTNTCAMRVSADRTVNLYDLGTTDRDILADLLDKVGPRLLYRATVATVLLSKRDNICLTGSECGCSDGFGECNEVFIFRDKIRL